MKKNKIFNNLGLKLLSLVLAILMWLVVANIEDPVTTKTFKDVKVKVKNENVLDRINKVYEVKSGSRASFTVKGRRSVLDNLTAGDFNVTANLAHLSDVDAVQVSVTPKNKSLDIEVYRNSNTMVVSLEDEAEDTFNVNVETTGEAADGYAIGERSTTPNIINVSGPKSLVKRIAEVRVKVDVSDASSDVTSREKLTFYDESGERLDSSRLSTSADKVRVLVQILKTKNVQVNVEAEGTPAKGYSLEKIEYEPQTVAVAGTSRDLQEISSVDIKDIDITGLSKDKEYTVKLSDYLPTGISAPDSDQTVSITVHIGSVVKRKLDLKPADISTENAQAGYDYSVTKSDASVVLSGYEDVVNAVTAQDLKPLINVSGLTEGTHECSVDVAELDGVKVSVSGTVTVEVTGTN